MHIADKIFSIITIAAVTVLALGLYDEYQYNWKTVTTSNAMSVHSVGYDPHKGRDIDYNGTGIMLDERTLLTGCHVVEVDDDRRVNVRSEDGFFSWGTVSYCSTYYDVATIRLDWPRHDALKLRFGKAKPFIQTFSFGYGRTVGTIKSGYVGPDHNGQDIDALFNPGFDSQPGDSGSPVLNASGQLLGMVLATFNQHIPYRWTHISVPAPNITFGITARHIKEALAAADEWNHLD